MRNILLGFCFLMIPNSAYASGKPKPPKVDPTIPNPYRPVILTEVGSKPFQLPGGAPANFTADFQTILNTSTTLSDAFIPSDPNWPTPCNTHLEIRSAVTSFQLNVTKAGISFGFSPGGAIGPVPGIKGTFIVSVGEMSFDASVWQCTNSSCLSIAAATANQQTVGTDLNFEVDFNQANLGAIIATNPALGSITRKLMVNTLSLLAKDPRVIQLPWQASVKNYQQPLGLVIFDAGTALNIKMNQTFEVYDASDSVIDGVCNVYKALAYMHTIQVGTVSSTALIDQTFNGGAVKAGDVVMIRSQR